jgi:hypothetical protein
MYASYAKNTNSDGPAFYVYTYQKGIPIIFGTSLHKMISSVQNIVTDMQYTCVYVCVYMCCNRE